MICTNNESTKESSTEEQEDFSFFLAFPKLTAINDDSTGLYPVPLHHLWPDQKVQKQKSPMIEINIDHWLNIEHWTLNIDSTSYKKQHCKTEINLPTATTRISAVRQTAGRSEVLVWIKSPPISVIYDNFWAILLRLHESWCVKHSLGMANCHCGVHPLQQLWSTRRFEMIHTLSVSFLVTLFLLTTLVKVVKNLTRVCPQF